MQLFLTGGEMRITAQLRGTQGKELQAIMLEIIEEFRELEKLPSIQFAIKKFNEVYVKFMWFYDYLDVGSRFQRAVTLIHSKLTDITQTALQAENR
ncbi:unnamed protein product, partial [Timema podura]|nr:unnamed protein product [Timema podura]